MVTFLVHIEILIVDDYVSFYFRNPDLTFCIDLVHVSVFQRYTCNGSDRVSVVDSSEVISVQRWY